MAIGELQGEGMLTRGKIQHCFGLTFAEMVVSGVLGNRLTERNAVTIDDQVMVPRPLDDISGWFYLFTADAHLHRQRTGYRIAIADPLEIDPFGTRCQNNCRNYGKQVLHTTTPLSD